MKITLDGRALKEAVRKLKPFMQKKAPQRCFESIWIDASTDINATRVTISATDLNASLNLFVPAKIDVPGKACIDFGSASMPLDEITIDADEGIATISTVSGTMSVPCVEWVDNALNIGGYFDEDTVNKMVLFSKDICSAIDETAYATMEDDAYKTARSVTITLKDETATFSALDGMRLAVSEKPALHVKPEDEFYVRIPGAALMNYAKSKPYGAVAVVNKKRAVAFVADDGIAIFRKDDCPAFPWDKCMPRESLTRALVSKKQIINFCKDHEKTKKPLTISINDDEIVAEAIGASVKAKANFHAKTEGNAVKFGVNPKYLREALEHLPVDDVVFCVIDKNKPIIICNPEYNEGFALVMPCRI